MKKYVNTIFRGGVSRKIVILLFMFGIVPTALLAFIFLSFYYEGQKKNVVDIQKEVCERISTNISDYLDNTVKQIKLIGNTVHIDIQNQKEVQHLANKLLDSAIEFDEIAVIDTNGNEVSKVSRYYTFRAFEFEKHPFTKPMLDALSGKIHISQIAISKFSKFPLVRVNVPILDDKHRIIGILSVSVNIVKMWNFISKYSLGEKRYAYIVDPGGFLIAYQDLSSVLEKRDLKNIEGVKRLLVGDTGVFEYIGLEGKRVIGASKKISPTGWGVIVEEPVKDALKDLYTLSAIFIIIFILTILFAIFLGLRFSYKGIIEPIRRLQRGAEALAKGDFRQKISLVSSDEIGMLANSFNEMAEDLDKTTVSRDSLVKEIEERKKVEETLLVAKEIVRTIPSGLFMYQYVPENKLFLLDANPAAENLTDVKVDKWRGKEFSEIWPEAKKGGITDSFLRVMHTGKIYITEDLSYKDDRLDKAFSIRAFPMPGKRLGVAFEDITKRKRAEKERTKLETQLQQAHKMESIGTLAGGIAHDFNNILGIILGNTELAIDDIPEGNPARYNMEEIAVACMRAKDVVRQILAFSRKTTQEMKPVKVAPIIQEALKLLRSSLPTTITILQDISTETDIVRADPTQLHQILINLFTNAAHAMDEKGGIIEIELENITVDENNLPDFQGLNKGHYVKLTVSDNGQGMEPNVLNRIFDPYFTTKEVGKGSGMGLSVVHGIVKSHEGEIFVKSEPGKGTCFTIFFKCIDETPEQELKITAEMPMGNETILLVDDEKSVVDVVKSMMERLGYEVFARTSSIEALEAFKAKPDKYKMVVSDYTMPNMTGLELTKKILKIRPETPLMLMTGYSEHITEASAKGKGVNALIMKPVTMNELANAMRAVLDNATVSDP